MECERIAVDTSKSVFTLHGVDERNRPILRRNLGRIRFEEFLGKILPTEVALEACGSFHHWGRVAQALGGQRHGRHHAATSLNLCDTTAMPL
jgi:transposase